MYVYVSIFIIKFWLLHNNFAMFCACALGGKSTCPLANALFLRTFRSAIRYQKLIKPAKQAREHVTLVNGKIQT